MIFAIQNSLKKYKAIIREILSKLNDVDLKMCNLLELARKDDEYARAMTQCQPLEIPLPPKAFFVKVKIDYPGVIIPNDETYIYKEVLNYFKTQQKYIMEHVTMIEQYAFQGLIENIPNEKINDTEPFWNNLMFINADPRVYYGLVVALRPKHVIEIGSGFSTQFCRRAIQDYNLNTTLIAVDPSPRTEILQIVDDYIEQPVQHVNIDIFDKLEAGDILFTDGSHVVFNGADSVHTFLNILPHLKAGVYIHFHDIMLPHEYARGYVAHYYAEQYMLASLLLYSQNFRVCIPNWYLFKNYDTKYQGISFWVQKIN